MNSTVFNCRYVLFIILLMGAVILASGCATPQKIEQPADDFTITKSIKNRMAADPELNRFNIRVVSRQGEVILSGTVSARDIKTRLIKLALSVPGVISVKDDIIIKKLK